MSGFYKLDGDDLLYAPNFVLNRNYELLRESHADHTYPVDGWTWFESRAEALAAFGIDDPLPSEVTG